MTEDLSSDELATPPEKASDPADPGGYYAAYEGHSKTLKT
jgi:hypothetical protein